MAISKRILTKIAEKSDMDIQLQKTIEKVWSGIEEGRQGQRIIDKIMKSINL